MCKNWGNLCTIRVQLWHWWTCYDCVCEWKRISVWLPRKHYTTQIIFIVPCTKHNQSSPHKQIHVTKYLSTSRLACTSSFFCISFVNLSLSLVISFIVFVCLLLFNDFFLFFVSDLSNSEWFIGMYKIFAIQNGNDNMNETNILLLLKIYM